MYQRAHEYFPIWIPYTSVIVQSTNLSDKLSYHFLTSKFCFGKSFVRVTTPNWSNQIMISTKFDRPNTRCQWNQGSWLKITAHSSETLLPEQPMRIGCHSCKYPTNPRKFLPWSTNLRKRSETPNQKDFWKTHVRNIIHLEAKVLVRLMSYLVTNNYGT